MTKPNALISVFDKESGVIPFARDLVELGWNIYSSGGTADRLAKEGIEVTDVASLVGGGAILGHKVVTLSRELHAGLLANYESELEEMEKLGLPYMDLVCFNFYPLSDELADVQATTHSVIAKTDIGGPTAVNSGAKGGRIIVLDESDYQNTLDWLRAGKPDEQAFIQACRGKAFFATSKYYAPAAEFHSDGKYHAIHGERVEELKYGENPYMNPAALYKTDDDDPLAVHKFVAVDGDKRSLVGLTDVDCLLQTLTHLAAGFEFNFGSVPLMAVGVKHGNACGAAVGNDAVEVIRKMVAGDKRALFGGVVMTNFTITAAVAEALTDRDEDDPPRLYDGIFAPAFDDDVEAVLARKKGKCRMMANPALAELTMDSLDIAPRIRPVRGGYLKQPNYTLVLDLVDSTVHGGELTDQQARDIVQAWAIGCTSNSNTITLIRAGQLIGNGVGQQDRVGAAELALKRARDAGHEIQGAVAWSDSFFPAPDGPEVLANAGVEAIFASSGSMRDSETIAMCEKHEVTLYMQPDVKVRGFAKH